jgi:hypothetical protein
LLGPYSVIQYVQTLSGIWRVKFLCLDVVKSLVQPRIWRTISSRLSWTAYSMHSQLIASNLPKHLHSPRKNGDTVSVY